jgi:biotin carboxylase
VTRRDTVIFVNTRRTALEAQASLFAAARLGLEVVLFTDRRRALVERAAVETVYVDTYDTAATVDAAREVARRRRVVGVAGWNDRDVEPVAQIAAALGLPGNTVAAARASRNKYTARTMMPPSVCPRFHRVRTESDLAPAARHVGFPAILKPAGAGSSRGIFEVADQARLRSAFEYLMAYTTAENDPIFRLYPGELVMEERISGTEHSLQGIVVDGELVFAGITDKWVTTPFCLEHLRVYPSALPEEALTAARATAAEVVTALDLRRGAIAMDYRRAEDGTVTVIELNPRPGGNFIASHLVPLSQGYDFLAETLKVLTGVDATPMPPACGIVAGSAQVITEATGRFTGYGGLADALAVPGIEHFTYETRLGSEVGQPPDSFLTSTLGSFIGRGFDQTSVVALLTEAVETCAPIVSAD